MSTLANRGVISWRSIPFIQIFNLMTMVATGSKIKEKYQGALVGALVGDCLGAPFEYEERFTLEDISDYINESEGQQVDLHFTDDTQMTQELADSLIEKKGFDAVDLAQRFVRRYYTDGENAGYGANVVEVFRKLQESNFADTLLPAKEQFNGSGSLGNGAAMRVAPVALFHMNSVTEAAELADKTAIITHTHEDGRHGAIFQCLAIRRCLANPVTDKKKFLSDFRTDLVEAKVSEKYLAKLDVIESLLDKEKVYDKEVVDKLGNGVRAFRSVPTALFCFLRGLSPIPGFDENNAFRRIMEYTINLRGDTDTIASMAGAIAGANFGLDGIAYGTRQSCEEIERAMKQADDLFRLHNEKIIV